MESVVYRSKIKRISNFKLKLNLGFLFGSIVSGLLLWLGIIIKNIFLVEFNVLFFTTFLTVIFINLILDKLYRGMGNDWIYVESQKKINYVSRCEHRESLFQSKIISKLFKKNWIHFMIIIPSFIFFYVIMVAGLIGNEKLDATGISLINIAPDLSWFFWFPLLWLLTWIANGRVWCQTCPFSGQAEWVQRRHPWKVISKKIGLKLRWPLKYSTILYSAVGFSVLTWVEEFYNIGGPGIPLLTSVVLIYIAVLEMGIALLFQDRTFCRTLCPLSAPLGITTTISPLGTFAAKDSNVCRKCVTKDCMKGNDKSHGCPWFASPVGTSSSPFCGLASDCYKACPHGNIDWPVKRFPWIDGLLTSRKRYDIAISVLILLGVVFFQFFNALPIYTIIDDFLNHATGWISIANQLGPGLSKYGWSTTGYPNPLDYAFLNAVPFFVVIPVAKATGRYKLAFTSISYSLIPIFAATILSRNLPKFLGGTLLILNEITNPIGNGIHNSEIYSTFWGSFLHSLGSNPLQATAEWWVLLIMEGVEIFGIYLSLRAAKELSNIDGIDKKFYYIPILILGIAFIVITYWMSSPNSPLLPFYNRYLGNLLYNPLQAQPPF
ncbi:4Fe-4S binding protein [Acidianus sulfidivorans JP7]|uniref:4Fe-4S binding protein n=1 Tax=Acidianus sulfidivorans JP7 TaxID=619593 RepID=A0A2U9ILG9_9CREN|nr:4Fe-4S binding protein [Acidianus sulfidivorans]AWR96899.1 4Fe-4S binding protein [Acidianus sulfidivorans JP7]